jgi:hypothetical protein
MDIEGAGLVDAVSAEGAYLRRAQALLAAREELFLASPARSLRLAGVDGLPQGRASSRLRQASRQLSLPLPRERTRRRARMVR